MPDLHGMALKGFLIQLDSQSGNVGHLDKTVDQFERLEDKVARGALAVDAVSKDAEIRR